MKDMIDEMFHGHLDASMPSRDMNSDYHGKYKELLAILDSMDKTYAKAEIERLANLISDIDLTASHTYFKLGFRLGARMMLSVLRDEAE